MIPINEYVDTLINSKRYDIVNESNDEHRLDNFIKNKEGKYYTDKLIEKRKALMRNQKGKTGTIYDAHVDKFGNTHMYTSNSIKNFKNIIKDKDSSSITKGMAEIDLIRAKNARKEHYKKRLNSAAVGAAIGAGAVGAGILAKKIYDKKKAAKEKKEEVKENFEYEEYYNLLECVVDCLTEEELMSENVSEFVVEIADYLVDIID